MSNSKHISAGLMAARRQDSDSTTKAVTVRMVGYTSEAGVRSTVVIGGKFTRAGDLADVTEFEAADLVARGRAEIVTG